jgi:hypothetical protein
MLTVTTPATYSFMQTAWFIVHHPFFTFKVRACGEARILLLADPFDVSLYSREIVIGGFSNTKVLIYDSRNATLAERDIKGLLNCNELQQFWISWNLQTMLLLVGRGNVGNEELLQYSDTQLQPIHAVSVSTANGISGEWQFSRDAGWSKVVVNKLLFIPVFVQLLSRAALAQLKDGFFPVWKRP